MCLLFLYLNDDPGKSDFKLIVASNRDEYWVRPTDQAKFRGDNPQWIGGMDMEPGREGGTWLGLSTTGRFGALLNILARQKMDKRGRGNLVKDFICGAESTKAYLDKTVEEKSQYNPFKIIAIDLRDSPAAVNFIENIKSTDTHEAFPPGVYSFDNSDDQNDLWKKTVDGESKFRHIVSDHGSTAQKNTVVNELYDLLNDKSQHFPDKQLQKQFMDVERASEEEIIEQRSARFVFTPLWKYGTRTNTVILIDFQGNCDYFERTLETPVNTDSPQWTTVEHQHKIPLNNL